MQTAVRVGHCVEGHGCMKVLTDRFNMIIDHVARTKATAVVMEPTAFAADTPTGITGWVLLCLGCVTWNELLAS